MFFTKLLKLFGESPDVFRPELPEDIWDRVFVIADTLAGAELDPISIVHFDEIIDVYTDDIVELFIRLDMLIGRLKHRADAQGEWKTRRLHVRSISIVDYYFTEKTGYMQPKEVLEALLKKLSAIHYQFESMSDDDNENYVPYAKREFKSIIYDVLELLEVCNRLRKVVKS